MTLVPDWLKEFWAALLGLAAGIVLLTTLVKNCYKIANLRLESKKLKLDLEKEILHTQPSLIIVPISRKALETAEHISNASFWAALKAFLLCLLIGGSGVGYVWQKERIIRLGEQIQVRERRLSTLQQQNAACSNDLERMIQMIRATNAVPRPTAIKPKLAPKK